LKAAIDDGFEQTRRSGFAFFPALLALVVWTVATSLARYRAVPTEIPAESVSAPLFLCAAARARVGRRTHTALGDVASTPPTERIGGALTD
jgi:hypothetical protein